MILRKIRPWICMGYAGRECPGRHIFPAPIRTAQKNRTQSRPCGQKTGIGKMPRPPCLIMAAGFPGFRPFLEVNNAEYAWRQNMHDFGTVLAYFIVNSFFIG